MKVTRLAAGFAIGYVLGTRAGRDKYDQIAETARRLLGTTPPPAPATAFPPDTALLDQPEPDTALLDRSEPHTALLDQPEPATALLEQPDMLTAETDTLAPVPRKPRPRKTTV